MFVYILSHLFSSQQSKGKDKYKCEIYCEFWRALEHKYRKRLENIFKCNYSKMETFYSMFEKPVVFKTCIEFK